MNENEKEKEKSQQPVTPIQSPDKSRDVTGGWTMWAQKFPMMNFIMFVFGWFTVPIEVLFRRDFGQRWLTVMNFYAGLFVLGAFNTIQIIANAQNSTPNNSPFMRYQQPQPQPAPPPDDPGLWHSLMDKSMGLFLLAYVLLSSYHFFRMWWRDRTYTALYSFTDGTSRFEPVAAFFMYAVNFIAIPVIRLYILFLPKEERQRKIDIPPLTEDVTAFTNTVFEPLLLVVLAIMFNGTTRIWLLVSAPALAVWASWKEIAKLNKVLDFRDAIIEAETMAKHRALPGGSKASIPIMEQAAATIRENPEVAPNMAQRYPDLMDVIEQMNREHSEAI